MMRPAAVVVALLCAIALAPAQQYGWTGQQRVHRTDADTADQQPALVFDSGGVPMVVWNRNLGDSDLVYSRWEAGRWREMRPVGPNGTGVWFVSKPRMCLADNDEVWLTWCNTNAGNTADVAFRRWDGSAWSAEAQVNQPDSTDLDFSPRIAAGGGEVWCVWYGGPTSVSPYIVFASRWDGAAGRWEPETQVSPQNNAQNWFCDVAVDSQGTPHVVWLASLLYAVYYSRFDGTGWTAPELVNDTFRVKAASWGAPQVVCDRTGMLHVSFTGVRQGAASRDIFYTRNDGSGWTDCEMVSQDSAYSEWYSNIAADRPDNVWVVYERQGEGTDQFRVYAQHFDGIEWSKEERLDDTTAYYDGNVAVVLDSVRAPWVVWQGSVAGMSADVFWSRWLAGSGVRELGGSGPGRHSFSWTVTRWPLRLPRTTGHGAASEVRVYDQAGREVFGRRTLPGATSERPLEWAGLDRTGRPQPAGVYVVVTTSGEQIECGKVVVLPRNLRR